MSSEIDHARVKWAADDLKDFSRLPSSGTEVKIIVISTEDFERFKSAAGVVITAFGGQSELLANSGSIIGGLEAKTTQLEEKNGELILEKAQVESELEAEKQQRSEVESEPQEK